MFVVKSVAYDVKELGKFLLWISTRVKTDGPLLLFKRDSLVSVALNHSLLEF